MLKMTDLEALLLYSAAASLHKVSSHDYGQVECCSGPCGLCFVCLFVLFA
jgi:hypothetical protein